jgi:hypothetical protein
MRPMVPSRLHHACGAARRATATARHVRDARRPSEVASDNQQLALVQTAFVQILDQGGNRLVEIGSSILHGVEDVVVDRVVAGPTSAASAATPVLRGAGAGHSRRETPALGGTFPGTLAGPSYFARDAPGNCRTSATPVRADDACGGTTRTAWSTQHSVPPALAARIDGTPTVEPGPASAAAAP